MHFRMLAVLAVVLTAATTGCSPSDIGRVEGTVTMDGSPLPNARLEFYPKDSGGLSAGRTDANGHYELYFGREHMGATVGEHIVQIRTAGAISSDGDYGAPAPEKVPTKYNNDTELTASVKAGSNTIDFDLDSQGKIVQPRDGY